MQLKVQCYPLTAPFHPMCNSQILCMIIQTDKVKVIILVMWFNQLAFNVLVKGHSNAVRRPL